MTAPRGASSLRGAGEHRSQDRDTLVRHEPLRHVGAPSGGSTFAPLGCHLVAVE